jgi:hypothetical protein
MHKIWEGVYTTCAYRSDSRGDKKLDRDAWQTGPGTLARGVGDCDDSAILLADWLIARGFDARVALGQADGQGHAWVVVLLEGKTYLLESTAEPPVETKDLLVVGETTTRYTPEMLFDRNACYYWKDPKRKFDNDYWSIQWHRLDQGQGAGTKDPRGAKVLAAPAANLNKQPTAKAPAPLFGMKNLADGSQAWQVSWPGL